MKKNIPTPLVDEYLESLQQAGEVDTDPFFYTRLKARMENEIAQEGRPLLKPGWLVGALSLFLVVNSYFLVPGAGKVKKQRRRAHRCKISPLNTTCLFPHHSKHAT